MKILVLGNVRAEGLELLEEFADVKVLPEPVAQEEILACISDVDGVLHKFGGIDAEVIARQSKLRIIARHGVGLDLLDMDSIRAAGIPVSTTQDTNSNAVAEAAVGLALSLLRHIQRGNEMITRDRSWARETLMGRELRHSTVGIVGYGRIGRLVAKYFAAFGSKILVNDSDPAAVADSSYPAVSLDELMSTADVVSLHCPLVPSTRNLIDAERLALLRDHAILINTARGGLIDQDALATALWAGTIGGAALDVFDVEPPDFDDPLFSCPNLTTTPHVAAMTIEAQIAMAIQTATELRRVLVDGEAPSNNVAVE